MCMFCKNTTTVESTTTHVVNYKNCVIVIKNVPCLECDQCGEKYYTDEVAEKLEIIVNLANKERIGDVFRLLYTSDITKFSVLNVSLNDIFLDKVGTAYEE